jgi:hypothetical protein
MPAGRRAAALAVAALVIYNANLRRIGEGDSRPASLLPFALWHSGSLTLDAVAAPASVVEPNQHYQVAYWQWRSPAGHLLSMYPIVTPVLVAPLYAPAAAVLWLSGWDDRRVAAMAPVMEKLAASLVAALSVGLFYHLLAGRLAARDATLLTVAYALGTGTWPISSQELWQHGVAELLAVIALLGIEKVAAGAAGRQRMGGGAPVAGADAAAAMGPGAGSGGALVAGLACGLMVANRPPDGFLAVALLGGLAAVASRRAATAAVAMLAAVAAAAPVAWYNLHFFGRLAGGYAIMGLAGPHSFYRHALGIGVLGLLVSPAKGLLLFSPFLAFLPLAAWSASRRWLAAWVAAGVGCQVLFYAVTDWRSGACYGPRFLIDAMPLAVWLLAPALPLMPARARGLLVAAVAASVVVQAVGAFCYPSGRSDDRYFPPGLPHGAIPAAVWSPANYAPWVEARGGLWHP